MHNQSNLTTNIAKYRVHGVAFMNNLVNMRILIQKTSDMPAIIKNRERGSTHFPVPTELPGNGQ